MITKGVQIHTALHKVQKSDPREEYKPAARRSLPPGRERGYSMQWTKWEGSKTESGIFFRLYVYKRRGN